MKKRTYRTITGRHLDLGGLADVERQFLGTVQERYEGAPEWSAFGRWWVALLVFSGIFVSAAGGFLMVFLWGVNMSVAVWVGFIALFGVAEDDGVVMGTYLTQLFTERTPASIDEVRELVVQAGRKRIRPCLMTIATTVFGLMPIFWAGGRGSDVMRPMAIPSVGGMAVSLITLFIVPCVFCGVEEWKWKRNGQA